MTRRPSTVTFVAFWAALGGLWGLMSGGLALVSGALTAGTTLGLVLLLSAVIQIPLSFAQLVLAGGLFKLNSLARTVGIGVFGLLAALKLLSLATGDATAVVGLVLNGACAVILVTTDAFGGGDRADISEGSANRIGTNYR